MNKSKQTPTVDNNDLAYFNSLSSVDAAYLAPLYLGGETNTNTTTTKKKFSETAFGQGLSNLWLTITNNPEQILALVNGNRNTGIVSGGRVIDTSATDYQQELEAAHRKRTNTFVIIGVAAVAVIALGFLVFRRK